MQAVTKIRKPNYLWTKKCPVCILRQFSVLFWQWQRLDLLMAPACHVMMAGDASQLSRCYHKLCEPRKHELCTMAVLIHLNKECQNLKGQKHGSKAMGCWRTRK